MPAPPVSAGFSPSTALTPIAGQRRPRARPPRSAERRCRPDRADGPPCRGDRARARPRQHAGRRSWPRAKSSKPSATRPTRSAPGARNDRRRSHQRLSADRRGRPRRRRERAPRLIELEWGKPEHPRVAIVGKGVCFDTGGLDIKRRRRNAPDEEGHGRSSPRARTRTPHHRRAPSRPSASADPSRRKCGVRRRLPPRRRRQVPQGPVCRDRQYRRRGPADPRRRSHARRRGRTRADRRLRDADRSAARVALGPDLPAMFANRDDLAADLAVAASRSTIPCWRMPLWAPTTTC